MSQDRQKHLGKGHPVRPAAAKHGRFSFEVVTRQVFTVTDREVAADCRDAVNAKNAERIDELVEFLNDDATGQVANVVSKVRVRAVRQ